MKWALLGVQAVGNSLENEECRPGWRPCIIKIAGEPVFGAVSSKLSGAIRSRPAGAGSVRRLACRAGRLLPVTVASGWLIWRGQVPVERRPRDAQRATDLPHRMARI